MSEFLIRTDRSKLTESESVRSTHAAENADEFRQWLQTLADWYGIAPAACLAVLRTGLELPTPGFSYRLETEAELAPWRLAAD